MAKGKRTKVDVVDQSGATVAQTTAQVLPTSEHGFVDATAAIRNVPNPGNKIQAVTNEVVALIGRTLQALQTISRELMADTIYKMAWLYHAIRTVDGADLADKAIKTILDVYTDVSGTQNTETSRTVFKAKNGRTFDFGSPKSSTLSRQMAQLYRDLGRWQAAIEYDPEYFGDGENRPANPEKQWQGSPEGAWDSDTTKRWKDEGTVAIYDTHGKGIYRSPVEALRDGRLFTSVHTGFKAVIRPVVVDLGDFAEDHEQAAYESVAEKSNNGPTFVTRVALRKENDARGKILKMQKKALPVATESSAVKGHLRGLAVLAKRNGSITMDEFVMMAQIAAEWATAHADDASVMGADDEE